MLNIIKTMKLTRTINKEGNNIAMTKDFFLIMSSDGNHIRKSITNKKDNGIGQIKLIALWVTEISKLKWYKVGNVVVKKVKMTSGILAIKYNIKVFFFPSKMLDTIKTAGVKEPIILDLNLDISMRNGVVNLPIRKPNKKFRVNTI